jgi:hypothetical protein
MPARSAGGISFEAGEIIQPQRNKWNIGKYVAEAGKAYIGSSCVFSGALGFLLHECVSKKADWADKLSFGFLAVSMSVFYGFLIYGMLAAKRSRSYRLMCGFKLLFYLASFLVGFFVVGRT